MFFIFFYKIFVLIVLIQLIDMTNLSCHQKSFGHQGCHLESNDLMRLDNKKINDSKEKEISLLLSLNRDRQFPIFNNFNPL